MASASASRIAGAQPAMPRVGLLSIGALPERPVLWLPFFDRMRALGYEEGRTITYLRGFAAGREAMIDDLARELVAARPALLVITGAREALTVQRIGAPIPCVMFINPDPVGLGVVDSLARPGGRMTGLTTMDLELYAKRLELLRELVPGLARAGILFSGISPVYQPGSAWARELATAADTLGVRLDLVQAAAPEGMDRAIAEAASAGVGGMLVTLDGHYVAHRQVIRDSAVRHRMPAVYPLADFVADGGLMSYSAKIADLSRRAADFADRILRGANPATLPVERPTSFLLAVNLAAARNIGLTVPPSLLARADEVIE